MVKAFDVEADDFIVKPYLPRVLCARIAAACVRRLQRKVALDRQKLEAQKAELGASAEAPDRIADRPADGAAEPAPRDEPHPAVLGGVP